MKAPEHRIFSIAVENAPMPGCTVSELVSKENGYYILHFSLAAGTSISAETYQYPKLWLVADGEMEAFTEHGATPLKAGDLYAAPRGIPVGVRAKEDCVYTEITLKEDSIMNEIIKDGAVFALKDLLPTQEDKIVNMDLINDEKLKFVVMSFAPGTALPEHAAPGEALIFALDGESVKLLQAKLAEAGFEVIEENVRSMWNPEETDLEAVPALVTSLLGSAERKQENG